MKHTLVIADDEKNTREGLKWALENKQFEIILAADGEEALEAIRSHQVAILLTDLKMPRMDGMELLAEVRKVSPETDVIVLTGHGTVESAVDAMKNGAFDYLIKPINIDELNLLVHRILSGKALQDENEALRNQLEQRYGFDNIVGQSEAMTRIFNKIKMVAPSRANVLLYGESGTGKELVSNAIHQNSPRKRKPFITVNCGALPLTLLESELFGHEKGAFTGAVRMKPGRFEMADSGTLFLDEISETAPEFQVRLLRVLQEGTFERVGGTSTLKVDVRVVAASNKRLGDLVATGAFREDLYYRLKVVEIELPALRERKEDIPLLVGHFLEEFARYYNKPRHKVPARTLAALQSYSWPGNVRQLRNVIEGAVVMSEREITLAQLPDDIAHGDSDGLQFIKIPVDSSMREAEKAVIQAALLHNQGNRAQTARSLELGRKTLYRKLKEYGIDE